MKKRMAILLAYCMAISVVLGSTASAASLDDSQNEEIETYTMEEMRTIALNALQSDFYMAVDGGSWDEVVIVKETPLYDLNLNLTAYCFDLVCGQQTAYIVIRADSSEYPVREFSNDATSPYLNVDTEGKMIYSPARQQLSAPGAELYPAGVPFRGAGVRDQRGGGPEGGAVRGGQPDHLPV